MMNGVFKIFEQIDALDDNMKKGDFEDICEFYSLQESLLAKCNRIMDSLPPEDRHGHNYLTLYEAFRILYQIKKNNLPV